MKENANTTTHQWIHKCKNRSKSNESYTMLSPTNRKNIDFYTKTSADGKPSAVNGGSIELSNLSCSHSHSTNGSNNNIGCFSCQYSRHHAKLNSFSRYERDCSLSRPFLDSVKKRLVQETSSFSRIFEERKSIVEQIDTDFPSCSATVASKEDLMGLPTVIGTHVVDYEIVYKLLLTEKEIDRKIEKFNNSTAPKSFIATQGALNTCTRATQQSVVNFYMKNIMTQLKSEGKLTDNKSITLKVCQDQEGSRYIQNQLDQWSKADLVGFFSEIESHALDLSTNLFGNYVIQKIIPLLSETEYAILISRFSGSIHLLSTHVYGCRVIQKLIDCVSDIDFIIDELKQHILELIASPNGNHVIQKCIDRAYNDPENSQFIIEIIREFEKDCVNLAQQRYGCRVLQRLFETSSVENVNCLLDTIVLNIQDLINDRYGNYVIQHLIQSDFTQKNDIFNYIIQNAVELSKYKFSSNVIEKCVTNASRRQLEQFLDSFSVFSSENKPALFYMCTDMYANYVVQKYFDTVDGELRNRMKEVVWRHLKDIKVIPFTKHILSKFDK